MTGKFFMGKEIPQKAVDPGVTRQVLAYSEGIMLVKIDFGKGAMGAPHTHPHEQVSYVVSGRFRFTNDDETREVTAGDSLHFAPGVLHGTQCLEPGTLIDVFTPCRKDFLPEHAAPKK